MKSVRLLIGKMQRVCDKNETSNLNHTQITWQSDHERCPIFYLHMYTCIHVCERKAMKIKVVYKKHEFHFDEDISNGTTLKYSFKEIEHLIQTIISAVDGTGRADQS